MEVTPKLVLCFTLFMYFFIFCILLIFRQFHTILFTVAKNAALMTYITLTFTIVSTYHNNKFTERILFHKLSAYSFTTFGIIHTLAHIINYALIGQITRYMFPITGIIILICIIIIFTFSLKKYVEKNYNIFFLSHFTNEIMVLTLSFHSKWMYILLVLLIIIRVKMLINQSRVKKLKVIKLCNNFIIIRLYIKKRNLLKPGDDIYLNCKNISGLEIHPYTIVKTNTENGLFGFELMMSFKGNWKESFKKLILNQMDLNKQKGINLSVLGPFNSGFTCEKEKTIIFFCQGIGITPALGYAEKSSLNNNQIVYIIHSCYDAEMINYTFSQIQKNYSSSSNIFYIVLQKRIEKIPYLNKKVKVIHNLDDCHFINKYCVLKFVGSADYTQSIKKSLKI